MFQIHPTQSYILCSVHEGRELENIILPGAVEVQPYAKLLENGPDAKKYNVGDKLMFNPSNAVFADMIDGEKLVIVPENCVFARYDNLPPIPNN